MSNRSKRVKQFAVLGGGALVVAPLMTSGTASATSYLVSNLNDAGAGSLREAIEAADSNPGADTITFASALTGTITLTTGALEINSSMTITGPGADSITVDGGDASRVLYLYNGSNIDVTVSGLTLANGHTDEHGGAVRVKNTGLTMSGVKVKDSFAAAYGGGVYVTGDSWITILNSEVTGNTGTYGGGVYIENATGAVIIRNTLISGNSVSLWGGGLYFDDGVSLELTRVNLSNNTATYGGAGAEIGVSADVAITITDCTVSNNVASGGQGGGISLETLAADVTITGSTFSGNSTTDAGGGLYIGDMSGGDVLIQNSTFSGNDAEDGGGIYIYDVNSGSVSISHSTITGNVASSDGGGVELYGGTVLLDHTVVAGNDAGDEGNDINRYDGTFEGDHTMIGDLDGMTLEGTTNLPEGDPKLGPLADNGGPTLTHLPLAGSPLINAGDPAHGADPAHDQRGVDRIGGGRIDVGAVEADAPVPVIPDTGSSSQMLAVIGAALLAVGGALRLTDRRRGRFVRDQNREFC